MALSASGTLAVSGGDDGTVRVWDALTGEPRLGPLRHDEIVREARFDAAVTMDQASAAGLEALIDDRLDKDRKPAAGGSVWSRRQPRPVRVGATGSSRPSSGAAAAQPAPAGAQGARRSASRR